MRLTGLKIDNLRIIESAGLEPEAHLNLIVGANGSGKTSLLEAIYLLCTGRSFRSRRAEEFIRRGTSEARVHAQIRRDDGEHVAAGVEKRPGSTRIRLDQATVHSAARLARQLPVIIVPPDSQRLVFDGADLRRRLLDWGLFHVEQEYAGVHQSYLRVLRQRNAQLRVAPDLEALAPWDAELEAIGNRLHALRRLHLERILPRVAKLAAELADMKVSIHYQSGWDETVPLAQALGATLGRDAARGYTGVGPHRADLELRVGDRPAHQVLSRGEAKLVCLALWIAQAGDHQRQSGRAPILLIDDLASELDPDNRKRVLEALTDRGAQSFVTSLTDGLLKTAGSAAKGFHVERGNVREMV